MIQLSNPMVAEFASLDNPPPVCTGLRFTATPAGVEPNVRIFFFMALVQSGKFLDYYTGDHTFAAKLCEVVEQAEAKGEKLTTDDHGSYHRLLKDAIPAEHRVLFPQLNVSQDTPPTLLVHAMADEMIMVHESQWYM